MSEEKKDPLLFPKEDDYYLEGMFERMIQTSLDEFHSICEECSQEVNEPLIHFRRAVSILKSYNGIILTVLELLGLDEDRGKEIFLDATDKLSYSFLEELTEKAKIELLGSFLSPQLTIYIFGQLRSVLSDVTYTKYELRGSIGTDHWMFRYKGDETESMLMAKNYKLLVFFSMFFEDETEDETEDEPEDSSTNEPFSGLQHFDRQLFCKLVNASKVDEQKFDEGSEDYTQRICAKYSLKWGSKVRQLWGSGKPELTTKSSKDIKALTKVRQQIIPTMPKEDQQILNEYIETHFSNFC